MSPRTPVSATRGRLVVISGPSGVGKDTVLRELFRIAPRLGYSISYTTRPPRPGEVDGTSYSFVDEATFLLMAQRREFLEYAQVHGHWYGTAEARVREGLDRGLDMVLKIDVQGAAWIRPRVEGAIFVFLLPPSLEELRRRLTERATESPDTLELRWQNAQQEMAQQDLYDHRVVNGDVHEAARAILDIIDRSPRPGDAARSGGAPSAPTEVTKP
ncbi:MAG: guanylate kinase [Candidatus Dormibacteria bacterium]